MFIPPVSTPLPDQRPMRTALRIALPCLLFATAAAAQNSQLRIIVQDQASGAPVANALVEVGGVERKGNTGATGEARLGRIPAGNRIVTVSRLGYQTARVPVEFVEGTVERTLQLVAEAVEVGGVTATGGARDPGLDAIGFYDRQARGLGVTMTADRIDEIHPMRTVDLFRRMRGFRLVYNRGTGEFFAMTTRGAGNLSGDCRPPMVYLDGLPVGPRGHYFDFIGWENIAAIEAFAGPSQVPAEYRSEAACGVILVWSKTGARATR